MKMSFDEDNNPFASGLNEQFTDLPFDNDESALLVNEHEIKDEAHLKLQESNHNEPFQGNSGEQNFKEPEIDPIEVNGDDVIVDNKINQILFNPNLVISIIEAGKSIEGTTKSYIVYTIKLQEIITRRRYSEFESLRNVLTKIFPLVIIPPIPTKSLVIFNNNEDKLIEHRKRTLTNFLNNCIKIEKIKKLGIFQKFLDPNSNWNDDLSIILSKLPKNILKSNPINGLMSSPIYSYLPSISTSTTAVSYLTEENFTKVEDTIKEYELLITNGLDKINKKLIKHFVELSVEYTDLGSVFNSFSLLETNDNNLSIMVDKIGQIFDGSYLALNTLISELDRNFMEPLGESVQFNTITRDIVKFRNKKLQQESIIKTNLKTSIDELTDLNKTEKESRRIENVLSSQIGHNKNSISFERPRSQNQNSISASNSNANSNSNTTLNKDSHNNSDATNFEPITSPKPSKKFKIPGLNKITNVIQGVIDQNPELTRKQKIISLNKQINLLKQCELLVMKDMNNINQIINDEFFSFQKNQILSFRKLLYNYNNFLLDWGRKNLELWDEVKSEILKL